MHSRHFTRMLTAAGAVCVLTLGNAALGGRGRAADLGDGNSADDAVRKGLLATQPFPRTAEAVRDRLRRDFGGTLRSHVVANGGHEHPTRRGVMFMSFETYEGPTPGGPVKEGELLIGYFLVPNGDRLSIGNGFVELIAWDRSKRCFNFWELTGGEWMYRGDSNDVRANVASINIEPQAGFAFTKTLPDGTQALRCSGCHTLGAPVMKELEAPHNDWWRTDRRLPLGGLRADPAVAEILDGATDASNLAARVKQGIDRLVAEQSLAGKSLRERLRSLTATMEMNLVSDTKPLRTRTAEGSPVEVPSSFFVDSRLLQSTGQVAVNAAGYIQALQVVDSRFPPGGSAASRDTHHAFLVPARSYIDNRVIDSLVADGVLDEELIADVLAVDMTRPVYSPARASLIRFIPDAAADAGDLRLKMVQALRAAAALDQPARTLLANLTDPARTLEAHRRSARAYLDACRSAASVPNTVAGWLRYAQQLRHTIEQAPTAGHPKAGNIVERGFREVFPNQLTTPSTALAIDAASCQAQPR